MRLIDTDFAALLCSRKGDLADLAQATLRQASAVLVDTPLDLPPPPTVDVGQLDEAMIETFVVEPSGAVSPTGSASPEIEHWRGQASSVARAVLDGLSTFGLTIDGPAYLTASATAGSLVSGNPHFDDDVFLPEAPIGLVAIVANTDGPRVVAAPVPFAAVPVGAQIEPDAATVAEFERGSLPLLQGPPNQVVCFPQFGQLHSGPGPQPADTIRNLFVFRATALRCLTR